MAASAIGPTSASDGVRTPPDRYTCGASAASAPGSVSTSKTLMEFVTTVIDDRCRSRRASSVVVVPALIAIVIPSSTVSAATAAIAAFSARC